MIHYFPLEPSEERWTGFMDRVITRHLESRCEPFLRYDPYLDPSTEKRLAPGSFYSANRVLEYRSEQLANYFRTPAKNGDLIFFTDLFVPGVEAVAYALHLSGVEAVICGLAHAGSFTDHDLMNPVERWAALHENAVLDVVQRVCVGSDFIRCDILQKRLVDPCKVVVTGFPLDPDLPEPKGEREPILVFNGRLSPEKQPWLWEKMKERIEESALGRVRYVNCIEEGLSKHDYYELLSRARVVVSFALQETFGTAIQEAVTLGCIPVVPNTCCYPEQFSSEYRYDTFDGAVNKVWAAMTGMMKVPKPKDCSDAVERWFSP